MSRKDGSMKEAVTRYTITKDSAALSEGGFRIVFLSDMHNRIWNDDIEYVVSLINNEKPDVVLCGGDMIEACPGLGERNLQNAAAFLRELSQNHKIYHAFGNHEYRLKIYPETYGNMYKEYMEALSDCNITWLDNDSIDIEVNSIPVTLYGLSISRKYYQRFGNIKLPTSFINKAIGTPKKDRFNILLAHHPRYIATYLNWGADLTLCGHYHGGVMRLNGNRGLISPNPSIFTHTAHGCIERNDKHVIISAGMGEHTIPFRIKNPREIITIDTEIW